MELISKVSKGSLMDQVYIPKRRIGFGIGSYVVIKPLEEKKKIEKPFFYNIGFLEPIKIRIIEDIFESIIRSVSRYDNIIITGSFLEEGFNFNDIDVILVSDEKIDKSYIEGFVKNKTGINIHIIPISNKALIKGLETDPLYRSMLGKCVSKKRFVYRIKPKINYKILDLHLLKSKLLIENFDFLSGQEKYEMLRNAVSIALFVNGKEVSKDKVDDFINRLFGKDMSKKIKKNIFFDKKDFLGKYKKFYKDLSSRILAGIKNGSK